MEEIADQSPVSTQNAPPQNGEDRSDWTYHHLPPEIEHVEDLEDYCPGGFAPLDIGDVLDERFEIFKKLGFGGCSIVWLCWEIATEKWYAVKVNAANNSSEDCPDLMMMKHFEDLGVSREELEANHIVIPFETFWIETPNGRHLCSVLPVLGPRLVDWREEYVKMDTERADKLCYQTAKGMSFLHSKGICHGDFRPQNILMKLEPGIMDGKSKEKIFNLLGMKDLGANVWTTKNTRSKHAPRKAVQPVPWGLWREVVEEDIAIVDFGEAYKASEAPERDGIPPAYASPEVLFGTGTLGFKSDVWSLAVTLLELRLDRRGGRRADDAIRSMERFIGPIPRCYRSEAKEILEGHGWELKEDNEDSSSTSGSLEPLTGPLDIPYDTQEKRDAKATDFVHPLEKRLGSEQYVYGWEPDPQDPTGTEMQVALLPYHLSRNEVLDFADLLKKMFKYLPDDRISASEVLSHRWFRKQHAAQKPSLLPRKMSRISPVLVALFSLGVWIAWNVVPWTAWFRCQVCGTLVETYKAHIMRIGDQH